MTSAVQFEARQANAVEETGCQNIEHILNDIDEAIQPGQLDGFEAKTKEQQAEIVDDVARRNVERTVRSLREDSATLERLVQEGRIAIVGAVYDVATGKMEFLQETATNALPTEVLAD